MSWVAICGVFAPTAMQFVSDQQRIAPMVAGKGARMAALAPGRAALVAAEAVPAATGTAIAAIATIAPRVVVNRVRDAKTFSSRDVSTLTTIRRARLLSHARADRNAALFAAIGRPRPERPARPDNQVATLIISHSHRTTPQVHQPRDRAEPTAQASRGVRTVSVCLYPPLSDDLVTR
jgi:hypothetical protein